MVSHKQPQKIITNIGGNLPRVEERVNPHSDVVSKLQDEIKVLRDQLSEAQRREEWLLGQIRQMESNRTLGTPTKHVQHRINVERLSAPPAQAKPLRGDKSKNEGEDDDINAG